MIFFVANDGTVIKGTAGPVYQGSANVNSIYLVAPFAAGLTATVSFRLPNGRVTQPAVMTPQGDMEGIVNSQTGQTYAGWSYTMPDSIACKYGMVTAQFYFYAPAGNAETGSVTATGSVSFEVGRGTAAVLPETPDEDVYGEILNNLSLLQQQLNSSEYASRAIFAWESTKTYGANEIVYYARTGGEGAFVKSVADGNKGNDPYANGTLDGTHWVQVVNFDEIAQGATVQVGKVTTGAAGTSATVTNVGTARAAIFDFTIPKGDTGVTGAGVYGFEIEGGDLVLYSQEEESPGSTYQIRTDGTLTITFN